MLWVSSLIAQNAPTNVLRRANSVSRWNRTVLRSGSGNPSLAYRVVARGCLDGVEIILNTLRQVIVLAQLVPVSRDADAGPGTFANRALARRICMAFHVIHATKRSRK